MFEEINSQIRFDVLMKVVETSSSKKHSKFGHFSDILSSEIYIPIFTCFFLQNNLLPMLKKIYSLLERVRRSMYKISP